MKEMESEVTPMTVVSVSVTRTGRHKRTCHKDTRRHSLYRAVYGWRDIILIWEVLLLV